MKKKKKKPLPDYSIRMTNARGEDGLFFLSFFSSEQGGGRGAADQKRRQGNAIA